MNPAQQPSTLRLYHGSSSPVPVGTVLAGRADAYERDWSNTDFFHILERYRPQHCLAHRDAVFAVADPDDIDLAGGATDWVLVLEVDGALVSHHDMNWSSQISCLLSEGHDPDSDEVRRAAIAYWSGKPHPNESVWEYLAPRAIVTHVAPYEGFDPTDLPMHDEAVNAPENAPRHQPLLSRPV